MSGPIQATTKQGDVVLAHQSMAVDDGFRNVSKRWWDQTTPIDRQLAEIAEADKHRERLNVRFGDVRPGAEQERFFLRVRDRVLYPDDYALEQLSRVLGIDSHYPRFLLESQRLGDADLLASILRHEWSAGDDNTRFVLHVQHGAELRGICHESTFYPRNDWYLRVLDRALPGARLSHWRGDEYTLYGNLLIPDTIRAESDSEYGAMVSLSNCELGSRPMSQRPSLFRAICMNGCIWGQTKGIALTVNRRAHVSINDLEPQLVSNIREQVPIAVAAIHRLLDTRRLTTDVAMKAVLAQACRDCKVSRMVASAVLDAWHVERQSTPDLANTLFAVVNGFTRAGQSQDNEAWVKLDTLGGNLAVFTEDNWQSLVSRAAKLTVKEVDGTFARWEPGRVAV